jgi:putative acetyltransferase
MNISFTVEPLSANSPALQLLLCKSNDYMAALYPAESNHLEDVDALLPPAGLLLGVFAAGAMIGCGAVKYVEGDAARADVPYGEIKRVFVLDEHRGRGISKAIMQALEAHLVGHGIHVARLETGVRQPEAIGLYRCLGYLQRPPFGGYQLDPLSVFMEKSLSV